MTHEIPYVTPVTTVPESSDLSGAAELMRLEAIGCLLVVDGDRRPVGMVTDRDLALRAVAWSKDPKTTTVTDVMSSPVHTVGTDATLDQMIERMRLLGVRRIPVVDEAGRAVGLVALDDLFETLSAQFEDLSEITAGARREARKKARAEHVRHEVQDSLANVRSKLEYASWHAQEAFLHELDEIRARVAKALKLD